MKKMGLSDWAALGELVASVAVVASLYYLIVGINQNTNQIRATANQGVFHRISDINMAVASDPSWSRIVVSGMNSDAQLTDVEKYRFDGYLEANLDVWDEMEALWDGGQISSEAWNAWNAYFEDWTEKHISASSWERLKWQYLPEHSYVAPKVESVIQKQ